MASCRAITLETVPDTFSVPTYTGKEITWDKAISSTEDLSPKKYAWDAEPPILPDANGHYPLAVPGVTQFA